MQRIFASKQLNSADLCSAWLMKTAKFIRGTHAKSAFVLTNSVSQGTQATFILDKIMMRDANIYLRTDHLSGKHPMIIVALP